MARIAAERMADACDSRRRPGYRRRVPSRVRFCALEGTVRVVIEADSEDDARYLCRDMGFEFIGLCD